MPVIGPRQYWRRRQQTKQNDAYSAAPSGRCESMFIYLASVGKFPLHLTVTVGESVLVSMRITKE